MHDGSLSDIDEIEQIAKEVLMATVVIGENAVMVGFDGWERLFTRRDAVRIPLPAVRGAELVEHPLRATRGGRWGITVTGLLKVGTWGLGTGRRQLVSARREVSGLRVALDRGVAGVPFDELIISTPDAAALLRAIRADRA
jgi:hypothetical protein